MNDASRNTMKGNKWLPKYRFLWSDPINSIVGGRRNFWNAIKGSQNYNGWEPMPRVIQKLGGIGSGTASLRRWFCRLQKSYRKWQHWRAGRSNI